MRLVQIIDENRNPVHREYVRSRKELLPVVYCRDITNVCLYTILLEAWVKPWQVWKGKLISFKYRAVTLGHPAGWQSRLDYERNKDSLTPSLPFDP